MARKPNFFFDKTAAYGFRLTVSGVRSPAYGLRLKLRSTRLKLKLGLRRADRYCPRSEAGKPRRGATYPTTDREHVKMPGKYYLCLIELRIKTLDVNCNYRGFVLTLISSDGRGQVSRYLHVHSYSPSSTVRYSVRKGSPTLPRPRRGK